jgi:hypothetical protein
LLEGPGGRTVVTWEGPIYPPVPNYYPGPNGSGVRGYAYRYRLNGGPFSAWRRAAKPEFALRGTRKGEQIAVEVRAYDEAGRASALVHASLRSEGPTLTPEHPGTTEPGETGEAPLYPEPK